MTRPYDLKRIQNALNHKTQFEIQQLIKKVQTQYHTDIFGFGEKIHQTYPHQWNRLKHHWRENFTHLPIRVTVDLQSNPGLANTSIQKGYSF